MLLATQITSTLKQFTQQITKRGRLRQICLLLKSCKHYLLLSYLHLWSNRFLTTDFFLRFFSLLSRDWGFSESSYFHLMVSYVTFKLWWESMRIVGLGHDTWSVDSECIVIQHYNILPTFRPREKVESLLATESRGIFPKTTHMTCHSVYTAHKTGKFYFYFEVHCYI